MLAWVRLDLEPPDTRGSTLARGRSARKPTRSRVRLSRAASAAALRPVAHYGNGTRPAAGAPPLAHRVERSSKLKAVADSCRVG